MIAEAPDPMMVFAVNVRSNHAADRDKARARYHGREKPSRQEPVD
jgi:hypothetical protein